MATVDELIIAIKADTKDLNKKLDKTNKKLKKSGQEAKKSSKVMATSFTKAAVGAAALGAAITKVITHIAKVGMAFEDLSLSLNKVFGGMEQGEAAMGRVLSFAQTTPFQVETVTKAFIALKSAGLEPNEKQLQTFADTASVATDSLGTFEALIRLVQRSASGGMGLEELNMISDRGIDVLGIFKEKLGLTKDDIATFGKTAEGAALMVDTLQQGLQEQFGGAMAEKMQALSTKTSNLTISWKLLMNEIYVSGLDSWLKRHVDNLAVFFNALAKSIKDFREKGGVNLYDWMNPPADGSNPSGEGSGGPTKEEIAEIAARGRELTMRSELLSIYNKSIDPLQKIKDLMLEGDEALEGYFKRLQDAGSIDENLKFTEFKKSINSVVDKADDVSTASAQIRDAVVSASLAFTQDFVNALLNAESALDAFKDFAKNIVSQIIAIFLQMAVVNEIMNAVFQLKGTNRYSTLKNPNPTDDNAGGGNVQKGRPTWVGERGPEIFVPNTGGTIMNNMNSKGMGGGTTVVVNQSVNFATGVVPTVRAEVQKMMPMISDVTKGAVLEAAVRGGSFKKGLMGSG